MIYMRLYVLINMDRKSGVYGYGGVTRKFLITTRKSPEFEKILDKVPEDKPLYCLLLDSSRLGVGDLSFMKERLLGEGDQVILIPGGTDETLPLVSDPSVEVEGRYIRAGVYIERALLFDSKNRDGYIDEELISNPLDLLRNKPVTALKKDLACARDIAGILWGLRNDIHVVSKLILEREEERIHTKEAANGGK